MMLNRIAETLPPNLDVSNGSGARAESRPVRVLLVSPTFGAYGGIEAFVLAVAEHVCRDPRFEVRVRFKRAAGFELKPGLERLCRNVPVEFLNRASGHLWSAIAWADLVHGQNASPDIATMVRVLRKPLALTIHNVLPSGPPLRRAAWRAAAAVATVRWYNSRFVWHTWEPRRVRAGSAHVPPVSQLPDAYVPPSARRGFVFLGRLVAGKGAGLLLDAYERAALDPDAWPMTIIGDGQLRPALEGRYGRTRGVRFAGFVEGGAKATMLAGARWLVAPSHWQEPFGLVALEARGAGVPCIVTADGGLPEAAGRDALVCSPGDPVALAELLRRAAGMTESDYSDRSRRTKDDLKREIVPASFYPDAYLRLLARLPAFPAPRSRRCRHRAAEPVIRAFTPRCHVPLPLALSLSKGEHTGPVARGSTSSPRAERAAHEERDKVALITSPDPMSATRPATKVAVSVVVPVRNEGHQIERCLDSVRWADEVFVVDSQSTDDTVQRAAQAGATVVQFRYAGSWPKKKNWALDHLPLRNDWVLLLDADEVPPPEAEDEFRRVIVSGPPDVRGYWINRRFLFMNRWLKHAYYPNWNLRLFQHRFGRFERLTNAETESGDVEIHEHVVVDGLTARLSCEMDHYAFPTVSAFVEKHNRYSSWEAHLAVDPAAAVAHGSSRARSWIRHWARHLPFRPLLRFLYVYVWQRGFLDGREGYYFARLHAFYEFLSVAKTYELRKAGRPTSPAADTRQRPEPVVDDQRGAEA